MKKDTGLNEVRQKISEPNYDVFKNGKRKFTLRRGSYITKSETNKGEISTSLDVIGWAFRLLILSLAFKIISD